MGQKLVSRGLDTTMRPPKKKPGSSLEADDEDDKNDDSFATFTRDSTAIKEENSKAHQGDAFADAALRN